MLGKGRTRNQIKKVMEIRNAGIVFSRKVLSHVYFMTDDETTLSVNIAKLAQKNQRVLHEAFLVLMYGCKLFMKSHFRSGPPRGSGGPGAKLQYVAHASEARRKWFQSRPLN